LATNSWYNITNETAGFNAAIQDFLNNPTSANLRAAMVDETGTGLLVFNTSPTLVTPVLGAATGTSLVLSGAATAATLVLSGSATIGTTLAVADVTGTTAFANTLGITANVLATPNTINFVAAGLIKTITVPTLFNPGGGTVTLIPTAAFTWDATGNIAIAGTAVIGRALTMTYDALTQKFYPSYV
jgi:hypothetical protein